MNLSSILCIMANFIIYLAFGSLITGRKKHREWSLPYTMVMGFFLYYSLFFFFCVPMMLKFQTLTSLSYLWIAVTGVVTVTATVICGVAWYEKLKEFAQKVKEHSVFFALLITICLVQIVVITGAYNFTLDASYYVGNVATSVQTDTINIYDPFTGLWQDHFEMRYFFATYSMNDAVMCRLTGLHALIWTKTVMTVTVLILIQMIDYKIAEELFAGNKKAILVMQLLMAVINFMFISIYTAPNFMLTRTFEGKAIVGNVVLLVIFYLYMLLLKDHKAGGVWWMLFIVCFGSMTISSSANMLVPAFLSVLFVPLVFIKKDLRIFPKYILCMLPNLCMAVMYVAYVKGYFVFHTY